MDQALSVFFAGGSKVKCHIIVRKEGEPGDKASVQLERNGTGSIIFHSLAIYVH